jgi:hypothetical protein
MLKRRMNEPAFVIIESEIRALYDLGCSAMVAFTSLSIEQRFGTTFASFKSWYYRLDQRVVGRRSRRRSPPMLAPVTPVALAAAPSESTEILSKVSAAVAPTSPAPEGSSVGLPSGHLTGSRFDSVFDAAVNEVLHKDKSALPSSLLDRSP